MIRFTGCKFPALCFLAVLFLVPDFPAPARAAEADAKAKIELGRMVFTKSAEPQCGICHTLKDAGTSGQVGPSFEELKPDAGRVVEAVRKGLGVMPPYAGKLTEEEIQAVAYYVSRAVGKEK